MGGAGTVLRTVPSLRDSPGHHVISHGDGSNPTLASHLTLGDEVVLRMRLYNLGRQHFFPLAKWRAWDLCLRAPLRMSKKDNLTYLALSLAGEQAGNQCQLLSLLSIVCLLHQ